MCIRDRCWGSGPSQPRGLPGMPQAPSYSMDNALKPLYIKPLPGKTRKTRPRCQRWRWEDMRRIRRWLPAERECAPPPAPAPSGPVRNLYRASSDVDELLSALHEALKPMVAQIAAKAKKGKRLAAREVLLLYVYLMLEERASRGRPAERQGAPDGRAQPGAP